MQKIDLLIKNGDVVFSAGVNPADLAIKNGKFITIGPKLSIEARNVIDATGKLVLPGVIDPHTHMGIPIKTTTSADDFRSGSEAAAFGGVTTILDFTVQQPGESIRTALERRIAKAQGKSCIDFGIHVNITDHPGKWLHQIPELIAEGFNSFKVFSTYREAGMMIDWAEFRTVLQTVSEHGGLLMLHAEDNDIIEARTAENLNAGHRAAIYHARSRPAEAEAAAIEKAAQIAGELDARLYIVHVSSKAGLEAGMRAKERGVKIYLETCPQYLMLDKTKFYEENGHYFIATPALRGKEDREALWQGVANGAIDAIGTDHCPFTRAQKDTWAGQFQLCPNGLPGVETSFPLLYTYGVKSGRISLQRLVELMCVNPAKIFGVDDRKGNIRVSGDADFFIWNPDIETSLSVENLHGAADWSPYEGMKISGKLESTFVRGKQIVANGKFCKKVEFGQLLRSS